MDVGNTSVRTTSKSKGGVSYIHWGQYLRGLVNGYTLMNQLNLEKRHVWQPRMWRLQQKIHLKMKMSWPFNKKRFLKKGRFGYKIQTEPLFSPFQRIILLFKTFYATWQRVCLRNEWRLGRYSSRLSRCKYSKHLEAMPFENEMKQKTDYIFNTVSNKPNYCILLLIFQSPLRLKRLQFKSYT